MKRECRRILVIAHGDVHGGTNGYSRVVREYCLRLCSDPACDVVLLVALEGEQNCAESRDCADNLHLESKMVQKRIVIERSSLGTIFKQLFLLAPVPHPAARYKEVSLYRSLLPLIEQEGVNEIHFQGVWVGHLAMFFSTSQIRKVLVVHDITRDWLQMMAKSYRSLVRRVLFYCSASLANRYDASLIECCDALVFLTEHDRQHYEKHSNRHKIDERESSVFRLEISPPCQPRAPKKPPYFILPGPFSYPPNYIGAKWLLEKVLPLIDASVRSRVVIYVTGGGGEFKEDIIFRSSSFIFTGRLSDAEYRNLLGGALCVLSPRIVGTGLAIKNIEALRKGVPVITTALGARSIESESLIDCGFSESEFAGAMGAAMIRSIASEA